MIYIDLKHNPPHSKWIQKAQALTKKLMAEKDPVKRNKLIDKNSGLWGEIKKHLLFLSQNKCWYSEAKESYSHYHVDHFRPKKRALDIKNQDQGGYWWLAFDWSNFRITGSVGNTKKGDRFYVYANKAKTPKSNINLEVCYFLDPTDEQDPMTITFNENGEVLPSNKKKRDWDYIRATYTIDNLDLNYPGLVDARRDLWTNVVLQVREIQSLIDKNNRTPDPLTKLEIKNKIFQLRELVKPKAQFSATTKACLLSSGLKWAMQIAA